MLIFVGTTVGGTVGWWMGSGIGFMTAFALSMVGTGAGMYIAIKMAQNYE
jgi:hypothetical protein